MSLASGLEMARVYIPARQQTQKERERDSACIRLLATDYYHHKTGKYHFGKDFIYISVTVVILLRNTQRFTKAENRNNAQWLQN